MVALGTAAPDFALPDVSTGRTVHLSDFADHKALLVMFICRHCPFVVHVQDELGRLGRDYQDRDIGIVAISSNDAVAHPDDAPKSLAEQSRQAGFTFPYLYDESQDVAREYDAACTPDLFLFNQGKLVYRGQLDDSRPNNGKPVTGRDLRAAIDAVLAGKPVSEQQIPSIGCNIKWKAPAGGV
jgi:peroxiredoxin